MSAQALRLLADIARERRPVEVERCRVAGLPALGSGVDGRGPTLVFANACTARGIEEPAVAVFLGGVARSGLRAVAPELPDVRGGVITLETVDALVRVAKECDGNVVLAGASTGGALAIIAAADPRLVGRVQLVSAIGPYADLANVLRLATTDCYADEGGFHAFRVEPRLRWAAERSLRAIAGNGPADALFDNAHPCRFDELLASLPADALDAVDALSPVHALPNVSAPVDVAFDPRDSFFPPCEAATLERAGARVMVTQSLGHVTPRPGLGLARLVSFVDRMLLLRPARAS